MKRSAIYFGALLLITITGCASTSGGSSNSATATPSKGNKVVVVDREAQERAQRVDSLLAQASVAAREGKLEYAFYLLLNAETLDPADDRALIRAAALHQSLGNREMAIKALQMALARNPSNGDVQEGLGYLLLETGKYNEAADAFDQAVVLTPKNTQAMIGLGLACEKLNDNERALRIYEQALSGSPSAAELTTYRARALMNLGRYGEARAVIAAVTTGPIKATWVVRGDLSAIDGDYAAALDAYLKVLSEHWAYQRLGEHALRKEELNSALRFFRLAAATSPRFFPDAESGVAVVLEKMNVR
jgi:tetratricopeptide (TPR) repeat protein